MNLDNLLTITRSYRSFKNQNIPSNILMSLISAARLSASARNSQTLRYTLVSSEEICNKIFPLTAWAGSIEWNPTIEESPTAYILISSLIENPLSQITLGIDIGIAAQNILLKASELNLGGCFIGAFNKKEISNIVELDLDRFNPQLLIALGKPLEKVILIEGNELNLRYYRDTENFKHFVPKLSLENLVLKKF
ncbi:nitroreductase family protein [uncultured Cetobacterium sp.]|uniref:nitroreductase family protein n=1 Tax=uncultured Cetobacterium sp. TaxID=527638 RepID=UPI002607A680|nr:nitroreductase family protein [uncultured Cetobacterium sp.]